MQVQKAALGSRNYRLGMSKAPTRGKVNPRGYIQREIRNRNQKRAGRGNDGFSDRRSGLAKSALNNAKRYASSPGKKQDPRLASKPKRNDVKITTPGFADPNDNTRITAPGFVDNSPSIPPLKINENGQLDLPFDEAFGLGLVDQQQSMNSELMDLQQQEQEQALDFANSRRNLTNQFREANRNTLNENAARGTAFSSGYGVQASDNARNFNNAINDLTSWNTQTMSGFGNRRMGIQNAFNDYVRQAVLRRSMDLAPEAGDLGYGVDKPKQVWNKPSSPKKKPSASKGGKKTTPSKGSKKLPTKPAKKSQSKKPRRIKKLRKW